MLADGDALEPNQPGKLPEVLGVREDPDPGIAEATLKQVLDKLQQLGERCCGDPQGSGAGWGAPCWPRSASCADGGQ